ncbi:MAG: hypothetical protein BM556_05075 [Bacteriovorax sp. MedPE-SWde]|nr:MAG: hypothetical protein BM556_05075 [Bacteriovorax sp. MedPE-SWde]
MSFQNLFKGKIKVKTSKKPKASLQFHFETQDFSIDQVVMRNFENISFNEFEKRELSASHRQIIKHYQTIDTKLINKYSKELIKSIKETNSDRIDIEAHDAGTFICLAAIYSGKLPKNKDIIFHLSSSPVQLFPQSLVKDTKAGHCVSVNLRQSEQSWLRSFTSLQVRPKYLEIGNDTYHGPELLFG